MRGPRSLDGRMYSYIVTRISAGSLMKGKVSIALSRIGGLPAPNNSSATNAWNAFSLVYPGLILFEVHRNSSTSRMPGVKVLGNVERGEWMTLHIPLPRNGCLDIVTRCKWNLKLEKGVWRN